MLFVEARRCSLSQISAVVLSLLIASQSVAQQIPASRPANKLAETSQYLSQSDKALACDPLAAEGLAKKALSVVSGARETDPLLIDTLGDLKSQSNLKISAAEKRHADLEAVRQDAQTAMKQAHPYAATDLLNQADASGCYAEYKIVRTQIAERQSQAASLIHQGDANLQKHPAASIELYQQAERIDAGTPDLATKLADAQDTVRRKARARRKKAIALGVTAVVLGGCVAGLVALSKHSQYLDNVSY